MFRMALALGCTVAELGDRMSYAELVEWMAYYMLEPWGCEPEDIRTSILAAASVAPFTKRRVRPKDFMPKWYNPKPTEDELSARIWAWAKTAKMKQEAMRGR